ncbi:MAG: Rdx family protein [Chloroflexi bacterium]|nr:Rdx family protein [Chloroflexota bacterium]MBV9595751.1 Rdx family protein [Chloroflexota bacterium]
MAESSGVKVTITYCAECGYEPQTLSLAEALMKAFTHELTSIELVPWYEGSFDVAINGELVHSMYREGGFPDNSTIVAAVKKQLAASSATVETA